MAEEYQLKNEFERFLYDRLKRKKTEKENCPKHSRVYDILKTEIAELEIVIINFNRIFSI